MHLEFLIPSYKRIASAFAAAESVISQINAENDLLAVTVWLQDDATPGITDQFLLSEAERRCLSIRVTRNQSNLGMSRNILAMMSQSVADFCTVLTDDDKLQPGALASIASYLHSSMLRDGTVGGFFVPRFCYLESSEYQFIVCSPFEDDALILPSRLSAVRFCKNGFVLTGLFVRPKLIDYGLWRRHADNAFFPVIYFGALLMDSKVLFINRNWFVHVVFNKCHWEAWGSTELRQLKRLFFDYLDAFTIVSDLGRSLDPLMLIAGGGSSPLISGYYEELMAAAPRIGRSFLMHIPSRLWLRPAFLLALLLFLSAVSTQLLVSIAVGMKRLFWLSPLAKHFRRGTY